MPLKKVGQILGVMFLMLFGSLTFRQVQAEAYCYVLTSEDDISVNLNKETSKQISCYASGDLPEGYYMAARYDIESVTTVWSKDEKEENTYNLLINFLKEGSGEIEILIRDKDGNDLDSTTVYYTVINKETIKIHYLDDSSDEYECDEVEPGFVKIQSYEPSSNVDVCTDIAGTWTFYSFKRTFIGWNTTEDGDGEWYYQGSVYSGDTDLYLYPQYTVDIDLSELKGPEGDSSYGWKEDESGVVYSSTDKYTTTKDYVDFYLVEVTPSPTPTITPTATPTAPPTASPTEPPTASPSVTPTPTPVSVPSQPPTQTTPAPVIPPTYPTTTVTAITEEEEQDEANPEWDEDYEEEETTTSKKTTKKTVTQFTVKGLKYKVLKNTSKKRTVAIVGVAKKGQKKYDIPAKVKFKGKSFQIVNIRKNAFKVCRKTKYLYIRSKTIQKIDKGALNGLSKKCNYKIIKSRMNKYRKMILKSLK